MPIPQKLPDHITDADRRRFDSFVDKSNPDGCWPWLGTKTPKGYGLFKLGGRMVLASRLAYLFEYGEDPFPELACHQCDTPSCTRGSHLFSGDQTANMQDASSKGRTASGDRNGARRKREKIRRGSAHGMSELVDSQVVEMREKYATGVGIAELAEQYGVCKMTVSLIIRGIGWAHVGGPRKDSIPRAHGERHPSAVLSKERAQEILGRQQAGERLRDLAKEYGVGYGTIQALCSGRSWKELRQ
jgi:hypothetical protein